ncbi:MAG TPA: UTP--glucose-1-phosphate uridylyltransferase, partial [Thermoprotei archaeon]|nr:UTP--glucose-1-phosphate uridylyltransferase [Thermoprotei archaeon]
MAIDTALLPVAGFGTRLLPSSKEVPKEMFPLVTYYYGRLRPIPVIQIIYETLYDAGIREFYFVISRGKEHIARYFTPHMEYVDMLRNRMNKVDEARMLESFYNKVLSS